MEELRKYNPELEIHSVEEPLFARYGTLHPTVRLPEMSRFLTAVERTQEEYYVPCEARLMALPEAEQFYDLFGQLPCQIGWYYGYNTRLNAVEYHKCSEILYELEPCVLILGLQWEIQDGCLDTGTMKLFYVPANTCVELYATTLHYAPCRAGAMPVLQIVAQVKDTNTPLSKSVEIKEPEDRYLLERNKWVLVHPEAAAGFAANAWIGLTGTNISIQPVEPSRRADTCSDCHGNN